MSESDINEKMRKDSGSGKITECIAGVYDINGVKGPNKQDDDIIRFNEGSLADGCSGTRYNDKCVVNLKNNYTALNCSTENSASSDYKKYCGTKPSGLVNDTWAGANKACLDRGMTLPDYNMLRNDIFVRPGAYAISGVTVLWSSTENGNNSVPVVNFYHHNSYNTGKDAGASVVCVGD